jgi:5'-methylthioadenosine phosphorylase
MLTDAVIIGGTGIGDVLARYGGTPIHVPTAAGQMSGKLIEHGTGSILVVSRHSVGHKVPPHAVNYHALALGLQRAGVRYCFSSAAVGSLRKDWNVGTMVACSDFLDLTGRHSTLFDREVIHTDFSSPFSDAGRVALVKAGEQLGHIVKPEGVYVCENGPRYETPHEIQLLTHVGDVVGMTAASEAILFREAGIDYSCLALVTNLAAGLEETPLSHEEVVEVMTGAGERVVELLFKAVDLVRAG